MVSLQFPAPHTPRRIELLQGLNTQEIDLILGAAKQHRLSPKSVMSHQGEPADHLLLLWKGRARHFYETPNGKKLILMWITAGDAFGGAALVPRPSTYLVSTETVQDSVVLAWEAQTNQALARRFPLLLDNALFIATDQFSWYVSAHAALTSQSARERLAHILAELAPSIGQKVPGGVEIDVSNEELANSANITPYTASRLIGEWQKSGTVRKRRGKILLRSVERLFLSTLEGGSPG